MQLARIPAEAQAPAHPKFTLSQEAVAGYLCILPALLIILAFSVLPVVTSLGLSLFRWNLASPTVTFVGLRNFETLFASETFWQVLQNTLVFSAGSVVVIVVLAFNLALLMDVKLRGIAVFRALLFVPHLVPMVVVATLWLFMLDPDRGPVNAILGLLGLPGPTWLQSTTWAMPAMILVKVWKAVGYGCDQTAWEAGERCGRPGDLRATVRSTTTIPVPGGRRCRPRPSPLLRRCGLR